MKKTIAIFLGLFLFIGISAQAQFNKPLQSRNSQVNTNEAKYNIGLIGGVNSTYWLHFSGTGTNYHQPINIGLTGGLTIERIINKYNSVGLEGYYATRKAHLDYYVLNYPVSLGLGPEHNWDYFRQLDVDYQEVNVQGILTHYLSKSNLRPYVFGGVRVSVPLSGKMVWQKTKIENYGTSDQQFSNTNFSIDSVQMNAQNMPQFHIGLVAGVGMMYKLNVGNYYFLLKGDISAHAAVASFTVHDGFPFINASVINSFSHDEIAGESQNVIGAGYIDPYLLGNRLGTDITAKITFLFPLKKQLKGACMRWGEYD
jgi:hypothetical protein